MSKLISTVTGFVMASGICLPAAANVAPSNIAATFMKTITIKQNPDQVRLAYADANRPFRNDWDGSLYGPLGKAVLGNDDVSISALKPRNDGHWQKIDFETYTRIGMLKAAVMQTESGWRHPGKVNYLVCGPAIVAGMFKGLKACGPWMVMPFNIGPWTRLAGFDVDEQTFYHDSYVQNKTVESQLSYMLYDLKMSVCEIAHAWIGPGRLDRTTGVKTATYAQDIVKNYNARFGAAVEACINKAVIARTTVGKHKVYLVAALMKHGKAAHHAATSAHAGRRTKYSVGMLTNRHRQHKPG